MESAGLISSVSGFIWPYIAASVRISRRSPLAVLVASSQHGRMSRRPQRHARLARSGSISTPWQRQQSAPLNPGLAAINSPLTELLSNSTRKFSVQLLLSLHAPPLQRRSSSRAVAGLITRQDPARVDPIAGYLEALQSDPWIAEYPTLQWLRSGPWIAGYLALQWRRSGPWIAGYLTLQWRRSGPWIAGYLTLQWRRSDPWIAGYLTLQ